MANQLPPLLVLTEHAGLVLVGKRTPEDIFSCDESCVHKVASQPCGGDRQGVKNNKCYLCLFDLFLYVPSTIF